MRFGTRYSGLCRCRSWVSHCQRRLLAYITKSSGFLVDELEAAVFQYTSAFKQARSVGKSLISEQPERATAKEALSKWSVLQLSDNKKIAYFVEITEVELYMQDEGE